MKYVLITDTHFGVKNNSMTWYNSQADFIYKQLIPHIESMGEDVVLIHLGDVFDSRSSISTYIMKEVRKMFEDLSKIDNLKQIAIIAGNHDFYSPVSHDWCGMEVILNNIPKVKLVIREAFFNSENLLLIPWYIAEEQNFANYSRGVVFTHSDILRYNNLKIPVFSGHMHVPDVDGNKRNLGSCFALDFNDHDQDRYFYVWDSETDELQAIPNTQSIKFFRIYNEDILNFDSENPNDYIEIYVKASLMHNSKILKAIERITSKYKNSRLIPQPDELVEEAGIENADIETIIKTSIPEHCREKFDKIKDKVNGNTQ